MNDWRAKERERLREKLCTATYMKDGALCWSSCREPGYDRPVPLSAFADAEVAPPAAQEAFCRAHDERTLAEYRKRMEGHVYSDEEMFEMRAAFGPGAEVVNVLTGKRIKL